ncbi:Membrane-associated protease RseP, regulator of RpoE activity [Haladaptatus litoreus]|uniref:Membrane-associated protease RseP, regulator of RpoE activity n=1 Tax=Haladaptatus litoreus TaxID=553468 RepID=A0A1N7B9G5_9EURY|nr:site-2 protease family protein [Haladaptatus litoreus]SIR47887.1 Membrane-associated protease RseP, regulator of RpoE activity [Haladaptatus litoreus]
MASTEPPENGPPLDRLHSVFRVYDVRRDGDQLVYYGEPLVPQNRLIKTVWPLFREQGYEVMLSTRMGEYVLVAEPVELGPNGVPWKNVFLFVATVLSTLWAGASWYHVNPVSNPIEALLTAWPFTLAVLGVLGTHELGHYVMSRYHGVDATLPYFIPMPTLIGTMGAVIRMKGQMPDRKALFDIGVSGPLAGLVATVIVTAVGLTMEPVTVSQEMLNSASTIEVKFGYPPLLQGIAAIMGEPLAYDNDPTKSVNPVVIGGWVGMFVTFLNLIPVGQLDGGHIVRAIIGERQESIAALVPAVLFGLAAYVFYVLDVSNATVLWVIWGFLSMFFAYVGPATPIDDGELDSRRKLIGILTFVLGLLCFTPTPIQIIS